MIAGRLTMRAHIERNQATGKDAWNQDVAPAYAPIGGEPVPCFVWSRQTKPVVDGQKSVLVEDVRALFALGANVRTGDQLAQVTQPDGTTIIFPGRFAIEGEVQFKHNHLEAALRRLG